MKSFSTMLVLMMSLAIPSAAARAEPTVSSRDCAQCPALVRVPAGRFMLGSTKEEQEIAEELDLEFEMTQWENPRFEVSIEQPFYIGVTEVTVGQFRHFVMATGYRTEAERFFNEGCATHVKTEGPWRKRRTKNWRNPAFVQSDDHPVVCVSWNDAQAYVKWLSRHTGAQYFLPSEAQWEYVARAGSSTARFWGDDPSRACEYANIADRAAWRWGVPGSGETYIHDCDDRHVHTAPVASFKANAFGVHDILGNVYEWVDDCWDNRYDPTLTDGRSQTTGDCSKKSVRGGSWEATQGLARSATRGEWDTNAAISTTGFRVAKKIPKTPGGSDQ